MTAKDWFMHIHDKIIISKTRICPPHYLPHKLPFGRKICDEPCHIHNAGWRMAHHISFCRFLGCENFKFMVRKNKEFYDKKIQDMK